MVQSGELSVSRAEPFRASTNDYQPHHIVAAQACMQACTQAFELVVVSRGAMLRGAKH